jgi:hypothetical protein
MPTHWHLPPIEIKYSKEDISKITLEMISSIRNTFDLYIDQNDLAPIMEDLKVWNAVKGLKKKGIRVRFVTSINEANISFCRELMKFGDIFHDEEVRGVFQIADGANYLCYITANEGTEPQQQLFHSNNKSFVDIQQCLFNNLCNKAIPAREKIKEIERGIISNFSDIIDEPEEIRKIFINQLMSAKDEILLLFSTSNSFYRARDNGMLNLEHVPNDVTFKLLIQAEDNLEMNAIQQELRKSCRKIRVQYITKPLQNKIVTVVVDQTTSVAIEIKDDTEKSFEEALGPAVYSNSEMTVSSCISIFETLWTRSELDKQNKVKQAYFQMFKELKLKDETYTRRWSFEQEQGK